MRDAGCSRVSPSSLQSFVLRGPGGYAWKKGEKEKARLTLSLSLGMSALFHREAGGRERPVGEGKGVGKGKGRDHTLDGDSKKYGEPQFPTKVPIPRCSPYRNQFGHPPCRWRYTGARPPPKAQFTQTIL